MKNRPPKFAGRLLRWFCHSKFLEELEGDLEENFERNALSKGLAKARLIYTKEVLKLMRPSVVNRNLLPSSIRPLFFWHFFKISFRNIQRNFPYSTLNVLGFAAALAVCLFCLNAIYSNHQLDKKFSDKERIYRVNLELTDAMGTSMNATTQVALYNKVLEKLPESESIALIQKNTMNTLAQLKGAKRSFMGSAVNQQFFDVFDFEMILGNPNDLFKSPKNIIITKDLMDRYFTPETVIGSVLGNYLITGVIENPSKVSHLDFEFLSSDFKDHNASGFYTSWQVYFLQQLYVKLLPNANLPIVKQKLQSLSDEINTELQNEDKGIRYNFILEPLNEVAQSTARFNSAVILDKRGQKLLIDLIIVLLAIAVFNYTNLAMASAIARTKEVGVRKVMGSKKSLLIYQFLIETSILSIAGFLLGLLIFKLLAPGFATFSEFAFQDALSLNQVVLFFLFALGTALVSGIIPGLYFSNISILGLFKNVRSKRKFSTSSIKKVLIVVQVCVSLLVFTLGFLLLNQSYLIINQSTPFSGENIVALDQPSSDSLNSVFRTELERISGVESVAGLGSLPYMMNHSDFGVKKHHIQDSEEHFGSIVFDADSGLIATLKQSIKWFGSRKARADQPYFLVNRSFVEQLSDSIKSVEEGMYSIGLDYYPVLGIIEDLNLGDPMSEARPAAFLIDNKYPYSSLAIRVNEASFKNTLGKIESTFHDHFPNEPFYPMFFDDILQERLSQFKNIVRALIFVFFSIIAITLMGQIGMEMFQAQTKEKEIGVRKVLGASFKQITELLLKTTFIQLFIAGIIACPLAYLVFQEVTPNFSVPLSLRFYHFMAAFIIFALLITALVSSQTWKVANRNPSESLRNE